MHTVEDRIVTCYRADAVDHKNYTTLQQYTLMQANNSENSHHHHVHLYFQHACLLIYTYTYQQYVTNFNLKFVLQHFSSAF